MSNIYVFDMGKVLIRPSNLKQFYKDAKPLCSYDEFRQLFYHSEESFLNYKGYMSDQEFFQFLHISTHSFLTANQLRESYIQSKGEAYSSTVQLIERLKQMREKVYLLSNLRVVDYEYMDSIVDLSIFDDLFLSYDLHMAKPDSEIFEEIIKKLGTNHFYFFDDSMDNIQSASSLGIQAFQVTGDTIEECFQKKLLKK